MLIYTLKEQLNNKELPMPSVSEDIILQINEESQHTIEGIRLDL